MHETIKRHIWDCMKNTNNKLDPTFNNVFRNQPTKKLTVKDIKDCYLEAYKNETGLELDAYALRKWLYRKIYKMLEQGYLIRTYEKGSSTAKYHMSVTLGDLGSELVHSTSIIELKLSEVKVGVSNLDILNILKEKEARYKTDLNVSIGESDEYEKIYESYPELKTALISEYEESKSKRSVLAGRLMAIRKISSHLG